MQITVYSNFVKRINSTKRPSTGGTAVTVALKDDCTIVSPTFILNTLNFDINYVEAFGNYYFAHVKNLDGHRCEIICTLDHLATFKTNIAGYTGFVEYASSAPASWIYKNDPRNCPTTAVRSKKSTEDPGWVVTNQGCYILAVASMLSNCMGGAPAYYVCTPAELENIVSEVYDQTLATNVEHEFNGVSNAIISCLWLPFSKGWVTTQISAVNTNVYIGSEQLTASADMILGRTWSKRCYVSLPNPLDYAGTYIQSEIYYTSIIYLPGVGVCPLSYDLVKDSALASVTVDIQLDFLTGDIVYYLSDAGANETSQIASFAGNVGAKVPVASASYDGVGVASGILETAGGVAMSGTGNISGSVGGILRGLTGIFNSLSTKTMVIGANSSPLGLKYNNKIQVEVFLRVPSLGAINSTELEDFRAEQGMPYQANATLGNLAGYIQCSNASVPIPGDGEEQNVVNAYINGGFYYE